MNGSNLQVIRDSFIAAIDKRLMTDVPYGVLLSGGTAATHCNTLQHTATHCNMQHTAICALRRSLDGSCYYNTLQHTATRNTLRYVLYSMILSGGIPAAHCNTLQHTATCNTLQHATHCNMCPVS